MNKRYVIASEKKWNKELASTLSLKLNQEFIYINQREDLTVDVLNRIDPQYVFFPHWSHIIPSEIWQNFDCVIFHMTDLPYGRGGSPLQNLIVKGHHETKLSALKCVKELDAGPIYLKKPLSLEGRAEEIFERANSLIEGMIEEIITHEPTPKAQEGEPVFFKRRKPEQSNMNELQNLEEVYNHIRMLDADSYPKAFLETDQMKFEFENVIQHGKQLSAVVTITKKEKDVEQ